MVFYKRDRQDIPNHYNRPLYVTVNIHDVELRYEMINSDSSLNITHLSILEAVGVPRKNY